MRELEYVLGARRGIDCYEPLLLNDPEDPEVRGLRRDLRKAQEGAGRGRRFEYALGKVSDVLTPEQIAALPFAVRMWVKVRRIRQERGTA